MINENVSDEEIPAITEVLVNDDDNYQKTIVFSNTRRGIVDCLLSNETFMESAKSNS